MVAKSLFLLVGLSLSLIPSGHTATAFMTATMLTKEYGHRSPWVGIGAYSVATATGLMRMANNKHWLSDVLTGAGIGILSTEAGYYLADLIFRGRGINELSDEGLIDRTDAPSFFGLYMGLNIPLSSYDIDEEHEFRTSSGSPARCGIGFGTGASLTFRASHHYGVKLFMDYNLLPSHSKSSGEYMNQLVGGVSFQITF